MIRRRIALAVALLLATALLLSPAPSSADSAGWCSALASGSPTIDVLGDSISYGDSVADPSRRWHALLGDSLRSGGAPGTQVWTGGAIPGSATADYLPGAKYSGHIEFTVNHPNVILLGWGTNDWAGGSVPPAVFQAQYQQIIDRIRFLSPDSTLVLIHMPWVYASWAGTRGSQVPYRDAERALAAANGAHYIGAEWPFAGDNRNPLYTSDLVHHTEAGQNVLFGVTRATLVALCAVST